MSHSGWDLISFYYRWKAGMLSTEKSGCQLVLAWASFFCLNLEATMPPRAGVKRVVWSGSYPCSRREGAGSPGQSSSAWAAIEKGTVAGLPGSGVALLRALDAPRGGSCFPSLCHAPLLWKVSRFLTWWNNFSFNLSSSWLDFQSFWGTELVYHAARPAPELAQGRRWEPLEQRWACSPFGSINCLFGFS